eukprot:CAMPEP_0170510634 /NCGR_PEP_ID=MMETSP0208-20121228/65876_1 /TAXON_ID=197538 /ORGANISM="Strombidium inclinatum, Strain S3" /LENGTH=93 /DNA_ID=CAMNT_0010794117 /DNA_START=426 /DNA_END=704 /DNA_ORIENTATION=+
MKSTKGQTSPDTYQDTYLSPRKDTIMMNPSPGGANEQSTSNPDPRAPVERFQTEVRFHNASEEIEEDKQVQLGRGLGDRLVGSESEDTTCHSK